MTRSKAVTASASKLNPRSQRSKALRKPKRRTLQIRKAVKHRLNFIQHLKIIIILPLRK